MNEFENNGNESMQNVFNNISNELDVASANDITGVSDNTFSAMSNDINQTENELVSEVYTQNDIQGPSNNYVQNSNYVQKSSNEQVNIEPNTTVLSMNGYMPYQSMFSGQNNTYNGMQSPQNMQYTYNNQPNDARVFNFGVPDGMQPNVGKVPKQKKQKNKVKKESNGKVKLYFKRGVAIVASAAVFGGVAGGTFNLIAKDKLANIKNNVATEATTEGGFVLGKDNASKDDIVIPTTNVEKNTGNLDVSDIAEAVMPSVVSITIKGVASYDQGFFGGIYEYETEGSGSGIIIGKNDKELLIVTNNHVVADANTVSVTFIDEEVYEAKVKGTNSKSDLAVIIVSLDDLSADTLSKIQIARIGDSNALKVGEQVVAIGNALGYGQSVTTGIVSAKDRTTPDNDTPLIQTDAAINPGNSGGALLNMNGEVIGINSSKYASYDVEGMGYAISISEVQDIINELSNRETRDKLSDDERGYLGITCETVTEAISEAQGIPVGVFVRELNADSPAKKAGIKKYNIITSVDGQSVSTTQELIDLLQHYKAGEKVSITFYYLDDDEYVEKTVSVVLGKKPVNN